MPSCLRAFSFPRPPATRSVAVILPLRLSVSQFTRRGGSLRLFVCTHNSARSRMAEGWLRHLAGDRFEVASAGVGPGTLHPLAGIGFSSSVREEVFERAAVGAAAVD